MEKIKLAFTGGLAISIFCLAGAIFYFSFEVARFNRQITQVVSEVKSARSDLPGILDRIETIRKDLPAVLASVNNASDAADRISGEMARIRLLIPGILEESEKIRATTDKASDSVQAASAAVENVRPLIPRILNESKQLRATTDNASKAVNHFSDEMDKVTPMVPDVLAEMKKTRSMIPEYLSRTEKLVRNAQKLSSRKTSGAVKGFVSGVIETPFLVAGTVRDSVKSLLGMENETGWTEADYDKINARTMQLLESEDPPGTALTWENPDTKIAGKVTFSTLMKVRGQECKKLKYEIYRNDKWQRSREITFCRQPDGSWMELMGKDTP